MALPSAIPRITAYGVLARDLIRPRPRGEAIHHATRKKIARDAQWPATGERGRAAAIKNGTGFRRDPACRLSPHHANILALAEAESAREAPAFDYRRTARPVIVEA
ncbi:MAG: hypothetical protein IIA34_13630 [Proteobacteria bacterium]|nr:hypothetical protein [Pseudomonadota bacterium]